MDLFHQQEPRADLPPLRFMDDWIVIAPNRWKLRKAVKQVNGVLAGLLLEKHPDKTFIGKATRGFTFLGYFLTPWAIFVSQQTYSKMKEHIARLYEQGADPVSIGQYGKRWVGWVYSGLDGVRDIITMKCTQTFGQWVDSIHLTG
jgi:RNA-directed DNA polymerase